MRIFRKNRGATNPTPAIYSENELRGFLDWVAIQTEKNSWQQLEAMHVEALSYLATKQRDYQGTAYLDQIEKNAIYLHVGTRWYCLHIATYLTKGLPKRSPEEVPQLLQELRGQMLAEARCHSDYVRAGCSGCSWHSRHVLVQPYYDQRRNSPLADYIEELEYSCIVYQTEFMLAQYYLTIVLNNGWAGVARSVDPVAAQGAIFQRVRWRAASYNGLVKLEKQPIWGEGDTIIGWKDNTQLGKPTWRDLWGDEFEKIRSSL